MEVLPSSGVSYIPDSDCPDQGSRPSFMVARGSNSEEHREDVQLTDYGVDDLELDIRRPLEDREEASRQPASKNHGIADAHYEIDLDGGKFSSDPNDSGDEKSESQQLSLGTCANITGSGQPSVLQGAVISIFESKWLDTDESLALWVKWRGKWQAGIRCARADWPLSILKCKPTHDEEKYLVIFFPRTKNLSWVDKLLVRPINEFPEPIAYKTREVGVKMVKDLSLAHRFAMQTLAVGTISILNKLHNEALVENSRNVMVWKEFAMEASRCKAYTDLGKTLLKLQNMILESCINSQWLQHSLPSWVQRCQNASSAELVDLLKEELVGSILWDVVQSLSTAQNELSTEWGTLKHEMMKYFSLSSPSFSEGNHEQPSNGSPLDMEIQMSRKRPKLEVRRAESHVLNSQMVQSSNQVIAVENDLALSNGDTVKIVSLESKPCTELPSLEGTSTHCTPDKWGEILVEARNSDAVQSKNVELTPETGAICVTSSGTVNKSIQCMAFIEHKGRQCVRWANEGDVYCCVHLTSRFSSCSAKVEPRSIDSPMCGGTTVLGTKCKHRSLVGSPFCKKHRPKDNSEMNSNFLGNKLKRKHEEYTNGLSSVDCKEIVLYEGTETPVQKAPISFMSGEVSRSGLVGFPEQSHDQLPEMGRCIGLFQNHNEPCQESPKQYFLYCDKHVPTWLKRARNGRSRIVSKEVFADFLKDCQTMEQKINLHRTCELFYRLFKGIYSVRKPVPKEVQFQWALSEAAKDIVAGESLLNLVCREKERLERLWGFSTSENLQSFASVEAPGGVSMPIESETVKCKLCSEKFIDDQTLGAHWMDRHIKEAKWHFRGFVCAICLDSFTNKKVLESHVQERHRVQFVEQCMLFQCIPCGSHFGILEELWSHVLLVHPKSFKQPTDAEQQSLSAVVAQNQRSENSIMQNGNSESQSANRKFTCKFCGLKFDLLPDLGRHHQAAHPQQSSTGAHPPKSGLRLFAQKLKSGRLNRPGFKKGIGSVSYRVRSRNAQNMKKSIRTSNLGTTAAPEVHTGGYDTAGLGRLADSQCSAVAQVLFSEIKRKKPRPTNLEILSIARVACCKVSLQNSLTAQYGTLPARIYLKAAKLCSEQNILVNWHQEGFICPRGCQTTVGREQLSTLSPVSDNVVLPRLAEPFHPISSEWTMDECHYVIDTKHLNPDCAERIVLCDDISFGKESIAIACAVDENLLGSIHTVDGSDGQNTASSFPWESFNYITKPLLDQSLALEMESPQLGCGCANSVCSSTRCDHVYLFDNDYEDAKDIYGKSMHGRFPYDERGRIILEEGYLVYECNQNCGCSRACQNRVLQNGVRVKLEIFKTETKGWVVRAREAILRGTFVCEYVGEIIDEQEANERRTRYGDDGCGYMYEVDVQMNDISRMTEGQDYFVIDATNHGNVSRYINHSCLPNLTNHQVLVESMDCQLAHIGLFASRDINVGEELTYDYRYKLQPGEGRPCLCGAPNCRGRLY